MIVIAINDLKMTAAAVEILLQIKSFLFIFLIFHLLARKGLESSKVETYLSYIDLELARMEPTLKDYINSSYGPDTLRSFKLWENAKIRLSHLNNDIKFFVKCRDQGVVPLCCQVKSQLHDNSSKDSKTLDFCSAKLVKNKICQKRLEKAQHTR